jgi:hypothetical protein
MGECEHKRFHPLGCDDCPAVWCNTCNAHHLQPTDSLKCINKLRSQLAEATRNLQTAVAALEWYANHGDLSPDIGLPARQALAAIRAGEAECTCEKFTDEYHKDGGYAGINLKDPACPQHSKANPPVCTCTAPLGSPPLDAKPWEHQRHCGMWRPQHGKAREVR